MLQKYDALPLCLLPGLATVSMFVAGFALISEKSDGNRVKVSGSRVN